MDLGGLVQNAVDGAVGAYAVQNVTNSAPNTQASESDKPIEATAADSYTPSNASDVTPDSAESVRQSPGSGELNTCYCGSCAACKARQAEKAVTDELRTDSSLRRDDKPPETEPRPTEEVEKPTPEASHELSEAEQKQVNELQQRDQEVRAHEQAHAAAGGRNVRFDYQAGPDGRQYAVGGSADIDMVAMSDDHATKVAEARKMRSAALAPADPSAQDMAVAARAARLEMEALAEQADTQREAVEGDADQQTQTSGAGDQATAASPTENPFFAVA